MHRSVLDLSFRFVMWAFRSNGDARNVILNEPFPPVSLPKREYMENARKIWEELELPKLRPQMPWFGYSLGQWSDELDKEAELAVQGRHFETGEKLKAARVKVR